MSTAVQLEERPPVTRRFAWLAVGFATWIVGGLFVVGYGYTSGLAGDSVVSVFHLPLYVGILALAVYCLALAIRAVRSGRNWRTAFPPGYGLMVAGSVVLLAWPIIEIGWREGVGIRDDQTDQLLAPSRLALILGCLLVAVAPLRAAQLGRSEAGPWPPVVAAMLVFVTLGIFGIQPAQNAWIEAPPNDPISAAEIWAMDADGGHQTRLIVAPAGFDVGNAVWSADGSQIVFTRSQMPTYAGQSPADVAVWTANADGTNQRQLIAGTGWYWLPHWSPDGQWITFTIDAQHGPGSGAGVLPPEGAYGLPPAGGQPVAVTPNVDIWRVRSDGTGGVQPLSNDPAEDRAAVYSPNGRFLLFDSTRSAGRTGLYVADADGSNARQLTALGDDWGGTWSPDMSRIAFNSSPTGEAYDIYAISFPGGGEPTRLTEDPASDQAPTWSPDGRRIAFESNRLDGQNDIWSMAADGSDEVNLTQTDGADESLTSGGQGWGPDGRILYYRSQHGPPENSLLVRQNLGVTEMLLGALILALLVIVLVGLGAPFGAVTLIMTVATIGIILVNSPGQQLRFLPAALIGGLVVDVAIRLAPDERKPLVGAVGAATAFVLSAGVTVIATSVLGWAPALLAGVAIASGMLAAGAAMLLARPVAATRDDDQV